MKSFFICLFWIVVGVTMALLIIPWAAEYTGLYFRWVHGQFN